MNGMINEGMEFAQTATREQSGRASIFSLWGVVKEQGRLPGRKTLLYFSEGLQVPASAHNQFRNMMAAANRANVAIYPIDARGLSVNGDKWGDYQTYPWTMGFAPSSRTEGQIFAKYALSQKPDAKFALLYQNDDLGKDFVNGLRDVLGAEIGAVVGAPGGGYVPVTITDTVPGGGALRYLRLQVNWTP